MNITHLKKEFTGIGEVSGFKFRQIHSHSLAYLYEVNQDGTNVHFEVFRRLKTPICLNFEERIYSTTHYKEKYPKSKDFGVWAWCITDKQKAIDKFNELSNE